ncbi:hypothetical protein [Streptomyces graminilatus]|uniref:hypothetical protein n=1 Tax=Streptomyces graminilatus TaxID=1464070 RepID=UPI0006E282C6|nr:hypothetical protein [Streptomyces graminilatus]
MGTRALDALPTAEPEGHGPGRHHPRDPAVAARLTVRRDTRDGPGTYTMAGRARNLPGQGLASPWAISTS